MKACRGRRATLEVRRERLPNGVEMEVDRVLFPRVVTVLPVVGDRVVLVRQYRPALGVYTLEAPAGVVADGEEPEEAARRELLEEAGLVADRLEKVFEGYVSPGYSTERAYIYVARDPRPGAARPEPYEVMERVELPLGRAVEMARRGEVEDMRTALALLLL